MFRPLLWGAAVFCAVATAPAAVIDVPAGEGNLNAIVGGGNSGRLLGDFQTHWQSGGFSVAVDTNGFVLKLDNGGGNPHSATGSISGSGSITVASGPWWNSTWNNPYVIGGSESNDYAGASTIVSGTARLNKPSGVDALRGKITVGSNGNSARLLWGASHQINNLASITVLLPAVSGGYTADANLNYLDLAGFSETIKSVTLADSGSKTQIRTGAGGVLTVNHLTVNGTVMGLGTYTVSSGFVTGSGSVVVVPSPPVDVPDGYSNPNVIADLGDGIQGTDFNVLGTASFGASTGTLSGDISIKGPARKVTLDTGGNPTVLSGALSGTGSLTLDGGDPPGLQQEDAPFNLIPWPKKVLLTGGRTSLATARIVADAPSLAPLATILASDIGRVHQVTLAVTQTPAVAGDIVLRLVVNDPGLTGTDAYRVTVDDQVTVAAETYQAVAFGMMTVLQALQYDGGVLSMERMTIEDSADRDFRALQVSIRGGYHSPQWVMKVIDLMRFYKVRVLQLHTTEALWVGAVLDSSNGATSQLLKAHSAWSKQEMEDVITYAVKRGVALVPHNEMRPNDPFWPAALTVDFNTTDAFAGYVDEIDQQGAYVLPGNLATDPRFWNFVREVSQRSYDQFARSWPDGKLPYYHIGPVYGEGGCSGQDAVRMLGYLKERNPDIRMMYWNGPGNSDPDLTPHRNHIVVDFYSATWGGTPDGLLAAGYQVCNVSWRPLYIQPGSRVKAVKQGKWIFDEFHLSRFGDEGPFGEPIAAIDASASQNGIIGAMLATWDFSGPDQTEGHIEMVSPCIPYFSERVWNIRSWPYPSCSWESISAAQAQLALLANDLLRDARPSSPPGDVTATEGVLTDAVDVLWAESDNYPEFYQVYRSGTDNSATAQAVSGMIPASFVTQINSFRDETVSSGQTYYYWVRSLNPAGPSDFSRSARGSPGAGVTMPLAGESFDYPAGAALHALAGGSGFGAGWQVEEFNAPLVIEPAGLTYPGLQTSGRALHVESTDSDETNGRTPPHVRVIRDLASPYGRNGTQVWTSYLIRAAKVEIGEIVANIGRTNIGKGWGAGISVYTAGGGGEMLPDQTYLLVARHTFHAGNDLIHLWVNPTPGQQPADTDAHVITRAFDTPESSAFTIKMQPYGRGSYILDEIRVGSNYTEAVPAQP